jgi:hypothetical protein
LREEVGERREERERYEMRDLISEVWEEDLERFVIEIFGYYFQKWRGMARLIVSLRFPKAKSQMYKLPLWIF